MSKDIFKTIQMPYNVRLSRCTDEEPLIFIPKDKNYIELAGHRIDNVSDMSELKKFLEHIKDVEEENKQLKKQMAELGEYVRVKYEEAKLDAQYIDGTRIPNVQERIYEDIFNRMELN